MNTGKCQICDKKIDRRYKKCYNCNVTKKSLLITTEDGTIIKKKTMDDILLPKLERATVKDIMKIYVEKINLGKSENVFDYFESLIMHRKVNRLGKQMVTMTITEEDELMNEEIFENDFEFTKIYRCFITKTNNLLYKDILKKILITRGCRKGQYICNELLDTIVSYVPVDFVKMLYF